MSDIGILGGTFDPIHLGHLCIAEASLRSGGMSKIILMPAKVSPFKLGREMASEEDRLAMAELTAGKDPGIEVSRLEIDMEGVSYTFRTLTTLHKLHPYERYWLIVGSDQFLNLESWYKGKDILEEFQVILAPRPGYRTEELDEKIHRYAGIYGTAVRVVQNDMLDISSTEIKQKIRTGKTIKDMVIPEVEQYINEHGLYREVHS
ncbi:MAG: nicotinate (nicotinamide) nucleotide adenylyltransferase [Eubacterium sp.]|nr:nicotinate (nicotinamide) nucleotide adenylyltransferase [Eubacterium sp.]